MVRSPLFTFINVGGLSLGFAVFFILWPYSQSELRGDEFITDHDKIARALYDWQFTDDGGKSWGQVLFPRLHSRVASEMKGNARIKDVTRLMLQPAFDEKNTPGLRPDIILSKDQEESFQLEINPTDAACVDKNFLDFFDCLGLLGMVSNTAVEKMKEINIRRILGAGSLHVTRLLLNSTAAQVVVAILVGLPVAWRLSTEYLNRYSHKIELAWWHFTVPVLLLAGLMLVTLVSVLWRATHTNAAEVLKHE